MKNNNICILNNCAGIINEIFTYLIVTGINILVYNILYDIYLMPYKILYSTMYIYVTVPHRQTIIHRNTTSSVNRRTLRRSCNVSRSENGQASAIFYIPWRQRLVSICSPYRSRGVVSIFFALYTSNGVHPPKNWPN